MLAVLHNAPPMEVTTSVAKRITEVDCGSSILNNFSIGINIFTTGDVDNETMEAQRIANAQADLLVGSETAPTLADLQQVHHTAADVHIPYSFAQLRHSIERQHAIWHVLL